MTLRARKGKKTSIGGQFAPRLIEMLESPAHRVLSLSARRVLDRIEVEIGHHGGNDNGKLPVTFDHFEEYGVHRHAIGPAIREAVALGFLEITEVGRSGNGEFRRPSLYRLTYRPTEKIESTDEWRKIETIVEAETIADAARKNKKPVAENARFRCGKRTTNGHSPVAETTTTRFSAETTTTSISRDDKLSVQAGARPIHKAGASGLPHEPIPIGTAATRALLNSKLVQRAMAQPENLNSKKTVAAGKASRSQRTQP